MSLHLPQSGKDGCKEYFQSTEVIPKNSQEHCCPTPDHRHQKIELHLLWCFADFPLNPWSGWGKWFISIPVHLAGWDLHCTLKFSELGALKPANICARVWHLFKGFGDQGLMQMQSEASGVSIHWIILWQRRIWGLIHQNSAFVKRVCLYSSDLVRNHIHYLRLYTVFLPKSPKCFLANLELQWIHSFRSMQSSLLRPPPNGMDLFRRMYSPRRSHLLQEPLLYFWREGWLLRLFPNA